MTPSRPVLTLALALAACPALQAQGTWPDKPVRIVVPLPPGGPSDIVLRSAIEKIQPVLKQPLIVAASPQDSRARLAADAKTWAAVARRVGLQPD